MSHKNAIFCLRTNQQTVAINDGCQNMVTCWIVLWCLGVQVHSAFNA